MKKNERIKLPKEVKDAMTAEIKKYFLNERDEELGDLAAALLLDFITEELAPEFYNQGILDACNFMKEKSEDLLTIQL